MSQELDIFNFDQQLEFINDQPPSNLSCNSINATNPNFPEEKPYQFVIDHRPSVDHGLPIPKSMLSEDAYELQNRQYHQDQSNNPELQNEVMHEELIKELGLEQMMVTHQQTPPENTKNVLRNLGNALNHFIFYEQKARKLVQQSISSPKAFDDWVRSLRMQNFDHFQNAWTSSKKIYTKLYKKLSWVFFEENAIPYILGSRIKAKTRFSHLKHVYRFLQGIQKPDTFNYFKKNN